jgi:hypothetical protein
MGSGRKSITTLRGLQGRGPLNHLDGLGNAPLDWAAQCAAHPSPGAGLPSPGRHLFLVGAFGWFFPCTPPHGFVPISNVFYRFEFCRVAENGLECILGGCEFGVKIVNHCEWNLMHLQPIFSLVVFGKG